MENESKFHEEFWVLTDTFVHDVYKLTRKFPHEELYGIVSQLRRASLSVMLNYVEGYARRKAKVNVNFLEISYGSLKESAYLLQFSYVEGYVTKEEYAKISKSADRIGAMLWGILKNLK